MSKRTDRMYGNSPKLDRDENGKVGLKKPSNKVESAEQTSAGTDGTPIHESHAHERRDMNVRHTHEMMTMHHRHEMEHMNATDAGAKPALHKKHEEEHKEMQSRHHSEMVKMHERHEKSMLSGSEPAGEGKNKEHAPGSGKDKIKKIEKTEKE